MFVLSEIQDTISVHPSSFSQEPLTSISDQINRKYANKVLVDVGLCISLFDITSCSEGKVRFGDGCLYYQVVFRMMVFRPFAQEVLVGKIKSSDESGIRITMGFFDDIYVPSHLIPEPSAFDHQERAWFWLWEPRSEAIRKDPLLSHQEERMYLDTGESIRFSVEQDTFFDSDPGPNIPLSALPQDAQQAALHQKDHSSSNLSKDAKKPHYTITATIIGSGLGLVSWWTGAEAQNPEEDYNDPSNVQDIDNQQQYDQSMEVAEQEN